MIHQCDHKIIHTRLDWVGKAQGADSKLIKPPVRVTVNLLNKRVVLGMGSMYARSKG